MAKKPPTRNNRVRALMKDAIEAYVGEHTTPDPPELQPEAAGLLMDLWGHQAAREGAFVLLGFALVEGRPLNFVDQSAGDLKSDTPRIDGDRAVSETLSNVVLRPRGVPATKGALQSSTYRSGYAAPQANTPALASFVNWASAPNRTLEELRSLFTNLAAAFGGEAFVVEDLPELDRPALVYAAFASLVDDLLQTPSQGAFQQYLFAALLSEYVEVTVTDRRLRVVTKPLFQSDKSAGTAGDVEIRAGQNLDAVFEVSANNWRTKLNQAIDSLTTRDELQAITILATDVPGAGSGIVEELAKASMPTGVRPDRLDVAVLDVRSECLSLAAKLAPRERAQVIRRLYDHLVTYCRTSPELVGILLQALRDRGLADPLPTMDDA